MITKHCQIQTVTLTFLLVLLPTVGRSQKKINPFQSGTPIIIGDGSVHIRSAMAPFDSPGALGNNWDMTKPKEFHRSGSGKTGQLGIVSLIGRRGADWSSFDTLVQKLVDFNAEAKDICKVEVKIGDPKDQEKVTIHDEGGKNGMVITSLKGLDTYKPKDGGIELVSDTTDQITEIDIYTDSSKKPTVKDKAFIEKNCPIKLYLGCGIQIGYK